MGILLDKFRGRVKEPGYLLSNEYNKAIYLYAATSG